MNFLRVATLAVLAMSTAVAAEWEASLAPKTPGTFPPLRPLKAHYAFGWAALSAGQADAEFTRKGDVNTLHIVGGSGGAVRTMWKCDADATSTVDSKTLQTLQLVQMEKYSDEKRTTTVVFTPDEVQRTRVREPKDKDTGKTKRFKFAPVRDLQGALLFLRSQPLKDGDAVRMVVYPNASAYLAEVDVLSREKVKVSGKEWPAIKVALKLRGIAKDLELQPHQKFKSATGWISDDADRLLLKIQAEVMVGKVWMELRQVDFNPAK